MTRVRLTEKQRVKITLSPVDAVALRMLLGHTTGDELYDLFHDLGKLYPDCTGDFPQEHFDTGSLEAQAKNYLEYYND